MPCGTLHACGQATTEFVISAWNSVELAPTAARLAEGSDVETWRECWRRGTGHQGSIQTVGWCRRCLHGCGFGSKTLDAGTRKRAEHYRSSPGLRRKTRGRHRASQRVNRMREPRAQCTASQRVNLGRMVDAVASTTSSAAAAVVEQHHQKDSVPAAASTSPRQYRGGGSIPAFVKL